MDRIGEQREPGVGPHGQPRRHFRIIKLLGIGGFGSVYEALLERPDGFRKTVALKILHDEDVPPYVLKRFRDEAKVLGLLRDRAIVGVDVPTKLMDRWSIIMECVDGATASQILKFVGPIPPRVALAVVGEIARALHKVYHLPGEDGRPIQLIHRDIKAANVSITREGDVKILDFGIARANFTARESSTLQNAGPDGTVGYIAPERFEGIEGPEGDIYSLGITLYVMLTRVRPTHIDRRADHPDAAMRSALELAVEMCELDASRRPTAQDVHRTCRSLVERMDGPSRAEWAERVVPKAQDAAQRHLSMSEEGDKLGLVGTILTEGTGDKPLMSAAPVTPAGAPSRDGAPSLSIETPSGPGLKVRTKKVRVPTGEVGRLANPRSAVPARSRPPSPSDPPRPHRSATPSRPPSLAPERRSVPPPPARTQAPPTRTPVPTNGFSRPASSRTPVAAGTRQHTPTSVVRERPVPRERTDPLAARADLLRERTHPGREGTNPRFEGPNPGYDGSAPRFEEPGPQYDPAEETQVHSDPRMPVPRDSEPRWAPPHLDPALDEPPARPSRFVAAGIAGVFTAIGLLATLGIGGLWVAENRPEWFDAVGVDPDEMLQIPAWMLSGGLNAEPSAEPDPPPTPAPEPPGPAPTGQRAVEGPAATAAVAPAPRVEGADEVADGKVRVQLAFEPPGVNVVIDGVQRVRDSPNDTSVNLEPGPHTFEFATKNGLVLVETIEVGRELGATRVELRDGELRSCRPPENIRRCTQPR